MQAARRPAGITLKMNSLVDPELIELLYQASQAGVQIDLIVRGICCLRPGVPGPVRATSACARSSAATSSTPAIYRFAHGAADGGPLHYIGSADLMPRNLDRRVEALAPVADPDLPRPARRDHRRPAGRRHPGVGARRRRHVAQGRPGRPGRQPPPPAGAGPRPAVAHVSDVDRDHVEREVKLERRQPLRAARRSTAPRRSSRRRARRRLPRHDRPPAARPGHHRAAAQRRGHPLDRQVPLGRGGGRGRPGPPRGRHRLRCRRTAGHRHRAGRPLPRGRRPRPGGPTGLDARALRARRPPTARRWPRSTTTG